MAAENQFHFTPDQRTRLRKAMGNPIVGERQWAWLESVAITWRQGPDDRPLPARDISKAFQQVAKSAKSLLEQMNSLPLFWPQRPSRIYRFDEPYELGELGELKNCLVSLIRFAEKYPKSPTSSRNLVRNAALQEAAYFFERVTKRPVSAGEGRDRDGHRRKPDSEFIRFVLAFAAECGATQPSRDVIRNLVRSIQKKRLSRPRGRPGRTK